MSPIQKARIRSKLRREKEKIATDSKVAKIIVDPEIMSEGDPDPSAVVSDEINKKIIIQIEEALKRLEDGTYGKCTECGEDIPPIRLKVLPFTPFCVKCKTREEEGEGVRIPLAEKFSPIFDEDIVQDETSEAEAEAAAHKVLRNLRDEPLR